MLWICLVTILLSTIFHSDKRKTKIKFRKRVGNPRILIATRLGEDLANSTAGAVKLLVSIKKSGDMLNCDFVVIVGKHKRDVRLERELRAVGWSFLPNALGVSPEENETLLGLLLLWNLTAYDQVIYLNNNCLVVGNVRGLLNVDLDGAAFWATRSMRDGAWVDDFDQGVFALRPDAKEFERLMSMRKGSASRQPNSALTDMEVLAMAFGSEFGDFGFANNANIAAYTADPARWHRTQLNVIHYSEQKPWDCGAKYAAVCKLWHDLEVTFPCEVTLVTSYFEIPSKHSTDEYREWMVSVLSLDACMVIVAANSSRSLFADRDPRYTKLVTVELDDAAKRLNMSLEFWGKQFEQDIEAFQHRGYRLYWIWALKSVLLRDAILRNEFKSDYFFWVDVGCLRDRQYFGRSLQVAPPQVRARPPTPS